MFLGSGGRFIEREGVSTLSIHGYPWALRYLLLCFQNCLLFRYVWVFKKSSFEKSQFDSYVRVFEKLLWKLLKSVGVKRFQFVLKRSSILENLPTLRNSSV